MTNSIITVVVLVLALLAFGCGSQLTPYVAVGESMQIVREETAPLVRELRRDAMTAAARRVHSAGGDQPEAEAAARAEAVRWTCAVDGHRLFGEAVRTYVVELFLARHSEDAEPLLQRAIRYARNALDAYRLTASCVNAITEEDTLPSAPAFLDIFPAAWSAP